MRRVLQFLTCYISKTVIESKLEYISDAFESDDKFDVVPKNPAFILWLRKSALLSIPRKIRLFFT